MSNPLLDTVGLPAFAAIKPRHVEPAIDQVLSDNRAWIARLTENPDAHTWETLVEAMETMQHRLDRVWSPVSHLNAVINYDELRDAYNACLGKLTDYASEVGQNRALFNAFESLQKRLAHTFDDAQRKLLENTLRDFRLSGVHLDDETRNQVRSLMLELSTLQSKFEENLLDASNAWSHLITDESELAGIPAQAVARAAHEARTRELKGWYFGLDFPSYFAIAGHADTRVVAPDLLRRVDHARIGPGARTPGSSTTARSWSAFSNCVTSSRSTSATTTTPLIRWPPRWQRRLTRS